MLDILVKNGIVIDGTGNPWHKADVGIQEGKVVTIDRELKESSDKMINARSLAVSPGFIDIHSHMDLYLTFDPLGTPKVMQGVTTELVGNCGLSCVPVSPERIEDFKSVIGYSLGQYEQGMQLAWLTYEDYLKRLNMGLGLNVAFLTAHNPIRIYVMGLEDRAPTDSELRKMKSLVRQGMKAGAVGFSTGLTYVPAAYSTTKEVIELARVASEYSGFLAIHQRYMFASLSIDKDKARERAEWEMVQSIREIAKISREANIPVQFSHLHPQGYSLQIKQKALDMIYAYRKKGLDVTYDVVMAPSIATEGMLGQLWIYLIPKWMKAGGRFRAIERLKKSQVREKIAKQLEGFDWNAVGIQWVKLQKNKWMLGKRIPEIAKKLAKSETDTICELLIEEDLETVGWIDYRHILDFKGESDADIFLKDPLSSLASDTFYQNLGNFNLAYGYAVWTLGTQVRERKIIPLEVAIQKMTSLPAQKIGLQDRGLIKEGFKADLVIFDPQKIKAVSEERVVNQHKWKAEGIHYVIVKGEIVIENGRHTGKYPGKVLRHAHSPKDESILVKSAY